MTRDALGIDRRAEELRLSFDERFSDAPLVSSSIYEDFLGIRVAENRFAVRLSEISGLFLDKVITPLPGCVSGLLGVTAFRGAIVPVYDLRVLLGYPAGDPPRWLALASMPGPVSVAFDKFERHFRASQDSVALQDSPAGQPTQVREIVRTEDAARPIIHLLSILNELITQPSTMGQSKER